VQPDLLEAVEAAEDRAAATRRQAPRRPGLLACPQCQSAKAHATDCLGRLNEARARIVDLEAALRDAQHCFNGQHNLLSTATEEERRAVVANFLNWWNTRALPLT
jgi:hypothetical protein